MKKIFKNIIYIFAFIGFMYMGLVLFVWLLPSNHAISTRGGICETNILSSKFSPDKRFNAAHIVEECSNGLVEHKFVISNGKFDVKRSGNNQIIHSTEIESLDFISGKILPIDINWKSNSSVSLKVQKGLEKVLLPKIAGVVIHVSIK